MFAHHSLVERTVLLVCVAFLCAQADKDKPRLFDWLPVDNWELKKLLFLAALIQDLETCPTYCNTPRCYIMHFIPPVYVYPASKDRRSNKLLPFDWSVASVEDSVAQPPAINTWFNFKKERSLDDNEVLSLVNRQIAGFPNSVAQAAPEQPGRSYDVYVGEAQSTPAGVASQNQQVEYQRVPATAYPMIQQMLFDAYSPPIQLQQEATLFPPPPPPPPPAPPSQPVIQQVPQTSYYYNPPLQVATPVTTGPLQLQHQQRVPAERDQYFYVQQDQDTYRPPPPVETFDNFARRHLYECDDQSMQPNFTLPSGPSVQQQSINTQPPCTHNGNNCKCVQCYSPTKYRRPIYLSKM
ncbi:hypothetical protein Ciccas_005375 [Cichlidogyrus casuarinus]|uniref:Uncharacterized protein n=1 Tax=Cichlidogyrus casuarinus TaxID=1844966 RepID=A0ABD2Q9A0_9PLAT